MPGAFFFDQGGKLHGGNVGGLAGFQKSGLVTAGFNGGPSANEQQMSLLILSFEVVQGGTDDVIDGGIPSIELREQ